ncbi:MAG: hypothetical protein NTY19_47305 [Planctomycetota bacterium]|nr:hypothetical protein [Planctomycetota bacterium]
MRIAEPVQLPLDLAGPSQYACFRISQRFPGPIQNGWVIAGDPQLQLAVLLARGGVEQASRGAFAEQGQEGLLAPGFQGLKNAFGVLGFRREGVIEKRFQIPTQFPDQVAVGASRHREPDRGRHADRPQALAVCQTHDLKLGGIALVDMSNDQRFHRQAPIQREDRSRKTLSGRRTEIIYGLDRNVAKI